eukprot:3448723-Pleurochrysis_carterae.AAC.1
MQSAEEVTVESRMRALARVRGCRCAPSPEMRAPARQRARWLKFFQYWEVLPNNSKLGAVPPILGAVPPILAIRRARRGQRVGVPIGAAQRASAVPDAATLHRDAALKPQEGQSWCERRAASQEKELTSAAATARSGLAWARVVKAQAASAIGV